MGAWAKTGGMSNGRGQERIWKPGRQKAGIGIRQVPIWRDWVWEHEDREFPASTHLRTFFRREMRGRVCKERLGVTLRIPVPLTGPNPTDRSQNC